MSEIDTVRLALQIITSIFAVIVALYVIMLYSAIRQQQATGIERRKINFTVAFMVAVQKRWARISKGKEALLFGYISANLKDIGQHAFIWTINDIGELYFYQAETGGRFEPKMLSVRLVES